jgi:KAP family P-loop domain
MPRPVDVNGVTKMPTTAPPEQLISVRIPAPQQLSSDAVQVSSSDLAQRAKDFGIFQELPVDLLSSISPERRPLIVSDVPTLSDMMGFEPIIRTLANIVLSTSTDTPLAIAIHGKWGSGKTSILSMLESQARLLGFHCIWVNAWALEQSQHLLAEVTQRLQEEVERSGTINSNWRQQFINFTTKIGLAILPAIPGGTVARDVVQLARTKDKVDQNIGDVESVTKELATGASIKTGFKTLVEALLGSSTSLHTSPDRRLLVFIDDLDRTLPDQVATIMKNLKNILEQDRCVFLLGMDMDLVADRIESFYRGHSLPEISFRTGDTRFALAPDAIGVQEGFGRSFLEKLVQIVMPVPKLPRGRAIEYVRALGFVNEVVEIVSFAPEEDITNPRRLKRYLNWLSLTLQLIMAIPQLPDGVDNAFALRSLALRRDFRTVYDDLLRGSHPLQIQWTGESERREEFRIYLKESFFFPSSLLKQFESFRASSGILSAM